MKTFKKIIAVLLAVIVCVSAATVTGFALEENTLKDRVGLYQDYQGNYRLIFWWWITLTETTQIKIYGINDSSEEILIHTFSSDDLTSLQDCNYMQVPADLFAPGGKYVMEIASSADESSADMSENRDDGKYYFTYEDITENTLPYTDLCYVQITEGETVDLTPYIFIPIGFDEPLMIRIESAYDSVFAPETSWATVDGLKVTVNEDCEVKAVVYTENHPECTYVYIEAEEREAGTFGELLGDSFEKLGEGFLGAAVSTYTTAISVALVGIVGILVWPALGGAGLIAGLMSLFGL